MEITGVCAESGGEGIVAGDGRENVHGEEVGQWMIGLVGLFVVVR